MKTFQLSAACQAAPGELWTDSLRLHSQAPLKVLPTAGHSELLQRSKRRARPVRRSPPDLAMPPGRAHHRWRRQQAQIPHPGVSLGKKWPRHQSCKGEGEKASKFKWSLEIIWCNLFILQVFIEKANDQNILRLVMWEKKIQ